MAEAASYERSAAFYDRLYAFKDYDTVNQRLLATIRQRHPSATSLLDVGCGTGVCLAFLRDHYDVEGSDLSEEMLRVARTRCPDVVLTRADMAELDLGRRFDVITCMFSAIGYVVTPERMAAAVRRMAEHLEPGGLLLVEPWFTPEQYWTGRLTVNHVDEADFQATWMYVSERVGDRSVFDIHYLVGTDQRVEHVVERHEMGLFPTDAYLAAFRDAGLEVEHDQSGFFGRGVYIGRRPGPGATA